MNLKIASASINTIALDLTHNLALIQQAIMQSHQENVDILLLPELCLSGYGCEDMFLSKGFIEQCQLSLLSLVSIIPTASMVVAVGFPWADEAGVLYNACALLTKDKIIGMVCKQHLAKSGVHYEPRWFSAWPQGKCIEVLLNQQQVPVGDLLFDFNNIRIGFEICEDAWVPNRVADTLSKAGVDLFLNPSASHFAIGKHQKRYQLVQQASQKCQSVYVYCNLIGCEAGRTIYDGGNLMAQNGALLLQGKRFSFAKLYMDMAVINIEPKVKLVSNDFHIAKHSSKNRATELQQPLTVVSGYQQEHDLSVALQALALGLWDWQCKTKLKGFVVSLSGGADSALCASAVFLAHFMAFLDVGSKAYKKELLTLGLKLTEQTIDVDFIKSIIMPQVLTTVYQKSINSGEVTENAASTLAKGLGAAHHQWDIADEVCSYQSKIEKVLERKLTWLQDDIALQNIQARVRSPGIWMLANVEQKLLIATSNLSEASVGYCTMDGDTSGVLAPIGGISKSLVLRLNEFLCHGSLTVDNYLIQIKELSYIINQKPTAELRPNQQSDETDLMPFEILDAIRELSQINFYAQQDMLTALQRRAFQKSYSEQQLSIFIKKYYQLYRRNQWKRERLAVSFHIEHDSACPKTYRRFPVLS